MWEINFFAEVALHLFSNTFELLPATWWSSILGLYGVGGTVYKYLQLEV